MKLKELEKRLKSEPENLGLRVQVAGLMREAGRSVEAVELYRSVALAYRDQGRTQQSIAVCRSILEIAPDDAACQGLLAMLQGRGTPSRPPPLAEPPPGPPTRPTTVPPVHMTEPVSAPSVPALRQPEPYDIKSMDPARRSSLDETPLPKPVPYHVSDPTSQPVKISPADLEATSASQAGPKTGLAEAARRISGMISNESRPGIPNKEMDLSAELDTRQRPKLKSDQVRKLDALEVEGSDVEELTSPRSDDEHDLATDQVEMLTPPPRSSSDDLHTPPHRPSDDALTPPPLDGHVPTEVREPPRSSAQPTRPPKVVAIPPKTSSGKTPSRPPVGTEPPIRPALPRIPKSRDSEEELTQPRDRPSLDDDDD